MLVTRRRLKECEVQRDRAIRERDECLRERDEYVRQLDEMKQLGGAGAPQLLRQALEERNQAQHLYEAVRSERDTMTDRNRTLQIECDRYREERDQAYGWVDRADREIIELRTENERLRAGCPRK
jgi:hypothetical protein